MNYKWEWSNKMQGEICSPVDAHGYRFILCVNPAGNFSVIKFLIRNSVNLPFSAAKPHQIASGWCETADLAKEHAIAAFERFTGIAKTEPVAESVKVEEPAKAEEPVKEEVSAEVEAVTEEIELTPAVEEPVADIPAVETAALEIQSEPAEDGQIKIWLTGTKENAKYKYTTNGKPIVANSKNYKDPFFVAPGTTVNVREALPDENGEEQYINISKIV